MAPAQLLADNPPQPELPASPPYVHELLRGRRSAEVDPADLVPLAEKVMECSDGGVPWDYVDESRALDLGRAKRDGNEPRIGGETLVDYGPVVVNGQNTTHDAAFYYLGVLKRLDIDVVYVQVPEDTDYTLVDAKTATSATMKGLPVTSPSGRFLAALGDSEMNWVGLEIVERAKGGLKELKKIETQTYPCGLKWLSDTRATFQELKPAAIKRGVIGVWRDETAKDYGSAYIELLNGEWIYRPAID